MSCSKASLCLLACRVLTRPFLLNSYSWNHRSLSLSVVYLARYKNKHSFENRNQRSSISNPGLDRRLKIIKQDTPNIDAADVNEEDIEELESDFMNAREMKEYHTREAYKLRLRDELKMTEHKHFKPAVEPNMLTWSDKEQIRHLHKEDPQVWNIDKLSQSFPATSQIIKKILKSRWRPESYDKIKKHDENVASNWEAFRVGKLNISCPNLKEHLKKFTKRTSLPFNSDRSELFEPLPKPNGSEFIGIIQSYKSLNSGEENNRNASKEIENDSKSIPPIDKYLAEGKQMKNQGLVTTDINEHDEYDYEQRSRPPVYISNKSDYTLEKLRDKIKEKQSGTDLRYSNEQDRMLLKGVSSSDSSAIVKQLSIAETVPINSATSISVDEDVDVNKQVQTFTSSRGISNSKQLHSNSPLIVKNIPDRIHIPKSKVKVGYLYKVNDCYYSHDGFFLYRVPGIVEETS